MNWRKLNFWFVFGLALAVLCCFSVAQAVSDASRLERYMKIVEREPFGEIAPSEKAPVASETPQEAGSKELEMRAIIDDGNTMRVGFFDKQKQKTFYIRLGETVDGLELVSADYENEEVLLRKGTETLLFSLSPQSASGGKASAEPSAAPAVSSLSRRRPFFTNPAKQPSDMQSGKKIVMPYRGKKIEEFLREHPDVAMKHPSPLMPSGSDAAAKSLGDTIERFLRENPDAALRFSPFQPEDPTSRVEERNEVIERFLREHAGSMKIQPPSPVVETPESVPFLFEDVYGDEQY